MKFKIGIIVAIIVIAAIGAVFWYSQKYSPLEELSKLNLYSKVENGKMVSTLVFLEA